MKKKIPLGISSCLLGNAVRYDGGHKLDRFLRDGLGRLVAWVPVCPEVEYGLPVPRDALRLVGDPADPRLISCTGIDHTAGMKAWATTRLGALADEGLCGFVFKSGSPSSGLRGVKVIGSSGAATQRGVGIFARAFVERFPLLPVEDDDRLQDAEVRENFIERIFVFARWREAERLPRADLYRRRLGTLMEGLRLAADQPMVPGSNSRHESESSGTVTPPPAPGTATPPRSTSSS